MIGISLDLLMESPKSGKFFTKVLYNEMILLNFIADLSVILLKLAGIRLYLFIGSNCLFLFELDIFVKS